MPTAKASTDHFICDLMCRAKPQRMLDVGVGFCRIGYLLRWALEVERGRYHKDEWQIHLAGVEIFSPYLTSLHKYLYDEVEIADIKVSSLLHEQNWDLVVLAEVLEHLPKEEALELVGRCGERTPLLLISSGKNEEEQSVPTFGNPHETHRCVLLPSDIPYKVAKKYETDTNWVALFSVP